MVDVQAPGVASRLRRIATIPNSSPNWPEKLLAQLGRLALLIHAFRPSCQLEPEPGDQASDVSSLQEDMRQLIGWTLDQDEVAARGSSWGCCY